MEHKMPARKESSLLPMVRSKLKVRAAVKGLSVEDIEKLIGNLKSVLNDEVKKEAARIESQKKAKIAKIKALMAESGLDPDDLVKATRRGAKGAKGGKKAAKTRKKAAPKYRLVVDGAEHLWSGRGRPPKVFKDYMDSGKSKESCAL
jgi:DNA-binding protein H-NS